MAALGCACYAMQLQRARGVGSSSICTCSAGLANIHRLVMVSCVRPIGVGSEDLFAERL